MGVRPDVARLTATAFNAEDDTATAFNAEDAKPAEDGALQGNGNVKS
jgi:hypothetical protein